MNEVPSKRILRALHAMLFLQKVFVFGVATVVILWLILQAYYEPKKRAAMRFCEALAFQIEIAKNPQGQYPAKIDPSWLKNKRIPNLIRTNHLYWTDGSSYGLGFWNPASLLDNYWFYSSRDHRWLNYDANWPSD